jgi:hypothetical protein
MKKNQSIYQKINGISGIVLAGGGLQWRQWDDAAIDADTLPSCEGGLEWGKKNDCSFAKTDSPKRQKPSVGVGYSRRRSAFNAARIF